MKGDWLRGLVKLETRELGNCSPCLEYTPDLLLCVRVLGEVSRDMDMVSLSCLVVTD